MTLAETGIIMDILKAAYPRFYSGPDAPDRAQTLRLWAEMFRNDDAALVAAAVKALLESDEKGYPPHIGAVKAKLRLFLGEEGLTEAEAWQLVAKAIRNGSYGSREEFRKLPPMVQRVVGSPSQLREWSLMESNTVHSVVASNFQRSYRALSQREQELEKLPPDVKALVDGLSKKKLPALPLSEGVKREIPCQMKGPASKN